MLADGAVDAIVRGTHGDPFGVLGMHDDSGEICIRAFQPQASRVEAIDVATGEPVAELVCIDAAGFFAGAIPGRSQTFRYRLRLTLGDAVSEIEDAYGFGPVLGKLDVHLIAEGKHLKLYEKFGAHQASLDGVLGGAFVVWAPNAKRVSVVGGFNDWDGRRNPMRFRSEAGVWEIFLPGVALGALYKYELLGPSYEPLPLKADPFAFACERSPATASVVAKPGRATWDDGAWLAGRAQANERHSPISVYEAHLGSWKRGAGNRYLTYRELADELLPYVAWLGFTHLELLPVTEHPFDGSWGYQPIGMFAPTSRFGTPEDFAYFVERAHAAGIGILLDWVPGHFPTDAHGLGEFDGTHLYEHADPRQGFQPDWNTLIFNFDRNEVVNYLIANALFWLDRYHVDGLRVDAVASMLYLDYSRKSDQWIPNRFGGRENLGAIDFMQRTNEAVYAGVPGAVTVAEESTAWPKVSEPVYLGGLGFGYKWNMGWMHDTLEFMRTDPLYRGSALDGLCFSFVYAFTENFVLPLSHDEVVHGKGSLIGKMQGDDWQRFANLRAYYGYMFAHPGKKLLFMGCEFAQEREWNHDRSLDWYLYDDPKHAGIAALVGDLNRTYRGLTALHELDAEPSGLEWIAADRDNVVVAFVRRARDSSDFVVAVTNFTPVVRYDYVLGVPGEGTYVEAINTDNARYGGSGVTNGPIASQPHGSHDKPHSIRLTLPPLATLILKRER
ncbi:MAG: 1,4-alpha-glucan branching protein GlgB [Candidatus Eremiobacteraeota bacterium]|nr:1,4-alpha-glucan branching protein GlgB [Candidatus Eremiobacteraeota bacterium]